jgi:hypothetical protein
MLHFQKKQGEKENLDCTYYVLPVLENKFQDVPRMLKAFEHWFGPYPFMKIVIN